MPKFNMTTKYFDNQIKFYIKDCLQLLPFKATWNTLKSKIKKILQNI